MIERNEWRKNYEENRKITKFFYELFQHQPFQKWNFYSIYFKNVFETKKKKRKVNLAFCLLENFNHAFGNMLFLDIWNKMNWEIRMYIFEEIQFLGILIFSYVLDENLHEKKEENSGLNSVIIVLWKKTLVKLKWKLSNCLIEIKSLIMNLWIFPF